MSLRKNWISLQLSEANESFKKAPDWMYYNSPLQEIKSELSNLNNKNNYENQNKSETTK